MATVNVILSCQFRRIYWLRLIGLVQRLVATWRCVLHSSNELGEVRQWLCHKDSTINILLAITISTICALLWNHFLQH